MFQVPARSTCQNVFAWSDNSPIGSTTQEPSVVATPLESGDAPTAAAPALAVYPTETAAIAPSATAIERLNRSKPSARRTS